MERERRKENENEEFLPFLDNSNWSVSFKRDMKDISKKKSYLLSLSCTIHDTFSDVATGAAF